MQSKHALTCLVPFVLENTALGLVQVLVGQANSSVAYLERPAKKLEAKAEPAQSPLRPLHE